MDFCWQSMSPLFNMLSRLVITFLPRSKGLLILWLQSPSAMILEDRKSTRLNSSHKTDFLGKVMSLLLNMPSRLVIIFLPRSKGLLILSLQSLSTVIFGAQKNSMTLFPLFPHLFPMK